VRLGKRGGMMETDSLLQRGAGGVAVEDRQTLPEAAPIPEKHAIESCFTLLCTDWCGPARDDSPASSPWPSSNLSRVAEVGGRARHGRMVERALTSRLAACIHEIACSGCIAVNVRVNILAPSGISCVRRGSGAGGAASPRRGRGAPRSAPPAATAKTRPRRPPLRSPRRERHHQVLSFALALPLALSPPCRGSYFSPPPSRRPGRGD